LADTGDAALRAKRQNIRSLLESGHWPSDFENFNRIFEVYHEALFYILSRRKGVALESIAEAENQTPDFRTARAPIEQFEVKTIDFAGGAHAYEPIMEEGLRANIIASEEARRKGMAFTERLIAPDANAKNSLDAIERVMRQIDRNVRIGQFVDRPTFLVVPMIRTALRSRAEELLPLRQADNLGGEVSGHLWTIAAHHAGAPFLDATLDHSARRLGLLTRVGILGDHRYVRGMIFLHTEWSGLTGSNFHEPFPDRAFSLLGIWNNNWEAPLGVSDVPISQSVFRQICDDYSMA
jgi:hypothetical protein